MNEAILRVGEFFWSVREPADASISEESEAGEDGDSKDFQRAAFSARL